MIVALYDQLMRIESSPVTELNSRGGGRDVDGPEAGWRSSIAWWRRQRSISIRISHARCELLRRLDRRAEAAAAYRSALALVTLAAERTLQRRLRRLDS